MVYQIAQSMLKGLLKTLKSEKASKANSDVIQSEQVVPSGPQRQQSMGGDLQIEEYELPSNFPPPDQLVTVGTEFRKIRYYVLKELPPMANKVIGCPISIFHCLPHGRRRVKQIDLNQNPFPKYLNFLKPLLIREVPDFNHVLINDYPVGVGIMPHRDGPAYLGKVFVLSLGSYAIINFQQGYSHSEDQNIFMSRVLLEPNSIHIFQEQAYEQYLHGITNSAIDCMLVNYNGEEGQVVGCSVSNYRQLECRREIQEQFKRLWNNPYIDQSTDLKDMRVSKIQGNQDYNFKVEIQRRQRISITIRHKFPS